MADMVKAEQVRQLREKHPDAEFVAYINTTADVKAEVDICVTSANAPKIIKKLAARKIVFFPDHRIRLLGSGSAGRFLRRSLSSGRVSARRILSLQPRRFADSKRNTPAQK